MNSVGRVHACDLEEINTVAGYRRLIDTLELKGPHLINWLKYFKNRKVKAGNFDVSKTDRSLPSDFLEQESQIEKLLY